MCVQPKNALAPVKTHGDPGKVAPIILVPSSLTKWASYQEVGPSKGWCVLIAKKVSLVWYVKGS